MNPHRDYLIIVNDKTRYEFNVGYDRMIYDDLVYIADYRTGEFISVEKGTYAAFSQLQRELKLYGIEISLYDAFRTKESQEIIYRDYLAHKDGGIPNYFTLAPARPAGFSEHHTGLLITIQVLYDYDGNGTPELKQELVDDSDMEVFKTIHKVAPKYGFIDRYPEGKEDKTGYPALPCELRFVGSSKIAKEIIEEGLCLEEYVELKK